MTNVVALINWVVVINKNLLNHCRLKKGGYSMINWVAYILNTVCIIIIILAGMAVFLTWLAT